MTRQPTASVSSSLEVWLSPGGVLAVDKVTRIRTKALDEECCEQLVELVRRIVTVEIVEEVDLLGEQPATNE